MAIIKRKPEAILTIAQGKSHVKPFSRKRSALRNFNDMYLVLSLPEPPLQRLFFSMLLCYTCSHHLHAGCSAMSRLKAYQ